MQILLVEDDERLAAALVDVLSHHGFTVDRARDAAQALALLGPATAVVVLDLGLPDRDGFEVCTRIRRESDAPIIMATARGDLTSRVHGLHLGADDYLVKPFDVRELMARIHAVSRRGRAQPMGSATAVGQDGSGAVDRSGPPGPPGLVGQDGRGAGTASTAPATTGAGSGTATGTGTGGLGPGQVCVRGVTIDVRRRTVRIGERSITLTRKEFDLLALLARQPGVVFRREQILSAVWQSRWACDQRTLEVHVASVRAKTMPDLIETVRGVGYRLATGDG